MGINAVHLLHSRHFIVDPEKGDMEEELDVNSVALYVSKLLSSFHYRVGKP